MNENLKVIVIDDEKPARDEMVYLLKKIPGISITGIAENGEEAINLTAETQADLLFLDIKMAEMNGFQVAEKLHESGLYPGIIFTTAYDQHALKAFDIRAVDYILKPVEEERLISSIDKYRSLSGMLIPPHAAEHRENREKPARYLSVGQGDSYLPVPVDKIVVVSAQGRNVKIKTLEREFQYARSIGDMETVLDRNRFFRCHRSYIINLDYIEKIDIWFNNTYQVEMKNLREKISVSRSYISDFRGIMSIV